MAPEKAKASEPQTQGAQGGSQDQPFAELQRAYQQAYFDWVQEIQQACIKAQAKRQDAYSNFARNLQEQSRSAADVNQYAEAYRRGTQQLQQTLSDDDSKNQFIEAYRNYWRAIQAAWTRFDPNAIKL